MANLELELLSNIVKHGDFASIRKRGMTPDSFQTEEARIVFQWLWDEYHEPSQHGEVPDKARLIRRFPDFDYCPSRNSVDALTTEMMQNKVKAEAMKWTNEMQAVLDEGEDPRAVLGFYLPKLRELNTTGAEEEGLSLANAGAMLRQEYDTKKLAKGVTGVPYPWAPLNAATGGMQPEEFIVIYGRAKNAKSWLALILAAWAYLNNRRVLVYSKEMSRETMLRRSASLVCSVDYELLRQGNLPPDEEEHFFGALKELEELETAGQVGNHRASMCFIGDKGKKKASSVDSVQAVAEKFEPDLILVDGFYLMSDARTATRSSDWKQITHISQDLKSMGQYMHCPVVGTTQANRSANKSEGDDLSELSYADAIGQDADITMRTFLGKSPTPGKSAVLLTFPGVRDGKLDPFLINFDPGRDYSILQQSVDVKAFLKDKQAAEREDERKAKGEDGKPKPQGGRKPPNERFVSKP